MRDSTLREEDPGSEIAPADKEASQQLAETFLFAGTEEKLDKPDKAGGVSNKRLSAFCHFISMDHMLQSVLPDGLKTFYPQEEEPRGYLKHCFDITDHPPITGIPNNICMRGCTLEAGP